MTLAFVLILLVSLLLIGMPVGFAIGFAGVVGLFFVGGVSAVGGVLEATPYSAIASTSLAAIPMFILMGEMIVMGGVADELFDTIRVWVGRLPGGLGLATIVAGAAFGAISGSSTAGAAALSGTTIPQMVKAGYDQRLANGLVAVVGTLAMMIPPSIALILYGILAEESVGKLLIAGIIPGVLISLMLAITLILVISRGRFKVARTKKFSFIEKFTALKSTWTYLILFILVLGSIYTGLATPTEAASVGAAGAIVLNLVRGRLTFTVIRRALTATVSISAMIMMMLVGAHIFGYFLVLDGVANDLTGWISGLSVNRYVILLVIAIMYLVLGAFMDQVAILALTVPVMVPIIVNLEFSPLWFGVFLILLAEIGMVTPPFGMNAFVVARYTNQPVSMVFSGIWPFVIAMLIVAALLVAFPQIVTALPTLMLQ